MSVFAFAEALAILLISSIPHCAQPVHLSSPPLFSPWNAVLYHLSQLGPIPRPPTLAPTVIGISNPPFLSSIPPVIPFLRALSPLTYLPLLDATVSLLHPRSRSVRTRRSSDYSRRLPFSHAFTCFICILYFPYAPRRRSAASGHPRWRGVAASLVGVYFQFLCPTVISPLCRLSLAYEYDALVGWLQIGSSYYCRHTARLLAPMSVSKKVISTVQHYSCHTRIVTNMAKLHGIGVLYGSMGTSADALTTKAGFRNFPPWHKKDGRSSSSKQINSLWNSRRFAYRNARRS